MGIRLLIPTVLATWLPAAAARATFVDFTIFGDGGASTVTIGPAGGTVPYTLFVETDPVGTPENLGLGLILITIDTDTGVPQLPAIQFEPPFTGGGLFGLDGDDVIAIRWSQLTTVRIPIRYPGIGQFGPQAYAHGELIIPPASVGTTFHASILIESGNPFTSRAKLFKNVYRTTVSPDSLTGNSLMVQVIPEPSCVLLLIGAGTLTALRRRARFIASESTRVS